MKTLQLQEQLHADFFPAFPPIQIEWEVTDGKDDAPLGKVGKQLHKAMPAFSQTWKEQLNVMAAFREFPFLFRTVFTEEGVSSLMKEFVGLEVAIKALNKAIKAHKQHPIVDEYYQRFDYLTQMNTFDIMKDDMAVVIPKASQRLHLTKSRYTTHDWSRVSDIDQEMDLGLRFKQAKKALIK